MTKCASNNKAYTKRMAIASILYVLAVGLASYLIDLTEEKWHHILIAFIPMIPCFLIFRAIRLYVLAMDELQLKIFLEACLFTLTLTATVCLTIGFLQIYKVLPDFSLFWIFSAIFLFFGVGKFMAHRRYK